MKNYDYENRKKLGLTNYNKIVFNPVFIFFTYHYFDSSSYSSLSFFIDLVEKQRSLTNYNTIVFNPIFINLIVVALYHSLGVNDIISYRYCRNLTLLKIFLCFILSKVTKNTKLSERIIYLVFSSGRIKNVEEEI